MAGEPAGRSTASGIEVPAVAQGPVPPPPDPGQFPYTRGIRPEGYRDRPWTMRQYAGFGSAQATNRRFHHLLEQGQSGLSVAFDLPTQMGYDSDHPLAEGEVGRTGVAIDHLGDMRTLLEGLPLERVSTSMTINAPAALLLLLYELVAEERGIDVAQLSGTIQNDILKEYAARGTYIYPPQPSLRLVTDSFRYCRRRLPRFNPISVSGYHIREAGATAPQELAFTLASGLAYLQAAGAAGCDLEDLAPRVSFFFNSQLDLLEEVAKFRAARSMWAHLVRDRLGIRSPRAQQLRFHAQTAGSALTSQQPLVNSVRVAIQALAAVLGGAQSVHTNAYDEALALPTEASATLALRTQQVIYHESGVALSADPLGGSYYVEWLTEELRKRAGALLEEVDRRGGMVAALEQGYVQREIADSAYAEQRALEKGERVVVGVNRYAEAGESQPPLHRFDEKLVGRQLAGLKAWRQQRDSEAVEQTLGQLRGAAEAVLPHLGGPGGPNLLEPIREALRVGATVGEVSDALRAVFGTHRPSVTA